MNNLKRFINDHSTLILTCISSGGVIITTFLAIKATPKAMKILENEERIKGSELTNFEKIKYSVKPYSYTIFSAISTILCILSVEYLNHRKQVSLISAYTLLENSYNNYRNNIKKITNNDCDFIARQEIVQAKYNPLYDNNDDQDLFFDYQSMRFFRSSMDNVIRAENEILDVIKIKGYACINEYYDCLGIPRIDWGYQLGWSDNRYIDPYNAGPLEFNYEKIIVGDGVDCWVVSTSMPATYDYVI